MRYEVAVTVVLALFLCLSIVAAHAQADEPGPLRVGIATADVTPESPAFMRGFGGRNKPSEGTAKEIVAQVVVFDNGQTRVALMALDHCWIEYRQALDLRAAAEAAGIPQQHLVINFSHNHYGPFFGSCTDRGFNLEYDVLFKQRTDPLFAAAVEDLQPALLDYTVGTSTMGVNRRLLDDEGKYVAMRPEPRKQIDPDVPIMRVLTADGQVRAVIFGYACHPTTATGQMGYLVGTDFPGHARDWMKEVYPEAEPIFLQGFGGDIKPGAVRPSGSEGRPDGRFNSAIMCDEFGTKAAMGHELARGVCRALGVPPPPVPADRPKDPEQALATPVVLGGILELVNMPNSATDPSKMWPVGIHMGALRIGDVYMFCGQGEILSSMALRIKRELGDMRVWTNAYCHTIGNYIGDAKSWDEGGYEAGRYAPQAEDVLVSHAMQFIRRLHYQPIHTEPVPRSHPTYSP